MSMESRSKVELFTFNLVGYTDFWQFIDKISTFFTRLRLFLCWHFVQNFNLNDQILSSFTLIFFSRFCHFCIFFIET